MLTYPGHVEHAAPLTRHEAGREVALAVYDAILGAEEESDVETAILAAWLDVVEIIGEDVLPLWVLDDVEVLGCTMSVPDLLAEDAVYMSGPCPVWASPMTWGAAHAQWVDAVAQEWHRRVFAATTFPWPAP